MRLMVSHIYFKAIHRYPCSKFGSLSWIAADGTVCMAIRASKLEELAGFGPAAVFGWQFFHHFPTIMAMGPLTLLLGGGALLSTVICR